MITNRPICISIVSHGQIKLISSLLQDLARVCPDTIEVILTINVPEPIPESINQQPFPLKLIHNQNPKGFAANHNSAFQHCASQYYCVLNPDIQLQSNPFNMLLPHLLEKDVGVVSALMLDAIGNIQDNARKFPTIGSIVRRIITKKQIPDYLLEEKPLQVDWIGGMFMLFRSTVYQQIGGFDERFFLYYEDVDLCARLSAAGHKIMIDPQTKIIHHAQRRSHRDLRYLKWHITSMLKYFYRYYLTDFYLSHIEDKIE